MADLTEKNKQWSKLIADTWTDDKLKQRLMTQPESVLKQYGIDVPKGIQLKVIEDTEQVTHLVLPPKPAGDVSELTAGQLQAAAGGWWFTLRCATSTITMEPAFIEYPTPMRLP